MEDKKSALNAEIKTNRLKVMQIVLSSTEVFRLID